MKYFDELKASMNWLAKKKDTIFIGQAVEYPGTGMTNTLSEVDKNKLFELPVAEEMQMGMSLGLSFNSIIPVSLFPRWNFLLCGMSQLVNHIDKLKYMNCEGFNSKIIIRTGIGSERPLHPQFQHVGDLTDGLNLILKDVEIIRLEEPTDIMPSYIKAYDRVDGKSTILVEYGDYYSEK